MQLNNATTEELQQLESTLTSEYEALKAQKLSLDLTRGKPSSEQLDLADALDGILKGELTDDAGVDTRNYGGLRGIMSARKLGADLLGTEAAQTLSVGNSSLNIMYMVMLNNYLYGCRGEATAWNKLSAPKMLCPVPGYDRHFSITENLGIEMINVDMDVNGPDMDQVEALIKADSDIIGMWCVPKYSNPTGAIYSDEVVDRIAALGKIANESFRVMWDNAYAVHDLVEDHKPLANITERCKAHGTEDSVWQFASTSKITYAGAGVSFVSSTEDNLKNFEKLLGVTTIGADKVNQLRTVKLLPNLAATYEHMAKHREILAPKFDAVLTALESSLDEQYATWTKPEGGYFVSLDTQPNLAKTVISMASDAGVVLTSAGAPFPYGKDPKDCNIRIAPSFPPMEELKVAIDVLITCIKLATVRQIMA
ncbi:aminotransferase class I/II-fold pyridoxal phosphate-dependent enzyme [Leucothrix sargassi]|nr:aminotransferase class I/II-fold pyridoxal phosphate-dependent enzyme [Leucothrix sargassi]